MSPREGQRDRQLYLGPPGSCVSFSEFFMKTKTCCSLESHEIASSEMRIASPALLAWIF